MTSESRFDNAKPVTEQNPKETESGVIPRNRFVWTAAEFLAMRVGAEETTPENEGSI
jgi:hypothetical protein